MTTSGENNTTPQTSVYSGLGDWITNPPTGRWELLLSDGTCWCVGDVDEAGEPIPHPLSVVRDGEYFPVFSELSIGAGTADLEVVSGSGFSIVSGNLQVDVDPVTNTAGTLRLPFTFTSPSVLRARTIQADATANDYQIWLVFSRATEATDVQGLMWTETGASIKQVYAAKKTAGVNGFSTAGASAPYASDMASRTAFLGKGATIDSFASASAWGTINPAVGGTLMPGNANFVSTDNYYLDVILDTTASNGAGRVTIRAIYVETEKPVGETPTEDQLSHGSYTLSSDNTTALTAAGTFTKLDVVTAAGQLVDFTHANNRLTYTGVGTKPMQVTVAASTSFSSVPAGAALSYRVAVNGTTVAASNIGRDVATNDIVGAFPIMLPTQNIAANDYIEVFADSDTNGTLTTTGLIVSIIETVDT